MHDRFVDTFAVVALVLTFSAMFGQSPNAHQNKRNSGASPSPFCLKLR